MLKPNYIDSLPDALVDLYAQAEMDILADMARRISTYDFFIPSAEFQFRKLQDMGLLHDEITKRLSRTTGIAEKEIKRLMEEAGATALKADDSIYRKAGLNPTPLDANPALQAVLAAGAEKTNGLFRNLTKTTTNTATKQFENALDRAYMQITAGAFDYNSAIRTAVKDLASKGVAVVEYPSGHVDYMEVAVRRATVTGVNQTAGKLQETRANEMGSDLVEVTAHAGARDTGTGPANHASWQGKVYSRSGTHPKYPDFVTSTGYGTGTGLCGWNCRHNFFPYFEGISEPAYSKSELKDMEAKNYTYNGQKLTEYEATQQQRHIERQVRKWKREEAGMKAAGLSADEAKAKIVHWQGRQRDFIKQTGLKRQYDREQIGKVAIGKNITQKETKKTVVARAEPRKFRNNDSVDSYFRNDSDYKDWSKGIENADKTAISEYSSNIYKQINSYNRKTHNWATGGAFGSVIEEAEEFMKNPPSIEPRGANEEFFAYKRRVNAVIPSEYQSAINSKESAIRNNEVLDNLISKFELKDDIITYRAVTPDALPNYGNLGDLIGKSYSDPSFMSTSPTLDSIAINKNYVMEIYVPKGRNRGAYLEEFTAVKKEYEFLLPRGSNFVITDAKVVGEKTIIRMEMLP